MKAKYDALIANNTWTLVSYTANMHLVGCKWKFKIKYNSNCLIWRYEARLIAKGFQQTIRVNYFETFSLVVKAIVIKIVLCLVVHYSWDIQKIDINNAFLNADLEEQMYMHQPEDFITDCKDYKLVCKLNKALHRLKHTFEA